MKAFISGFLLAALAGLADAQNGVSQGRQPGSLDAQRAAISAERVRLEAGFASEDAVCHDRFAVNNCLDKVNINRRQAMAELRRQEMLLNDEERKNRGKAQIRKIEEKSLPEKQQEAAERRAKATEDYQLRLEREKKQQPDRTAASLSQKTARDVHTKKLMDHQKKVQARVQRQTPAAEEAKKFNDRKNEAEAHKAQHKADELKRTSPPAKSLPLPELTR